MPGWNDADFKANFCVSHATFVYLVNELQPSAEARALTQYHSSGPACCYCSLETGNQCGVPDDCHLFGDGLSSVCVIVHQVCEAIVVLLGPQYIKLPQGEGWQTVVDGFLQRWQFPQCVGAMDGSHIPIIAPPVNAKDYYNRKGFHSILLQGVVDHQCRFMDIYIGWPGSLHDAHIFANSNISLKLRQGPSFLTTSDVFVDKMSLC